MATTVAGGVLGILAGMFTTVYRRADGALMARATAATVAAWVLGTIGRLVFGLYAEHGGGPAIASFSHAHGLTFTAWAAALILMAARPGGRRRQQRRDPRRSSAALRSSGH